MKQFYKDGACRKIRPPFTSCRFLFQYIVSLWVRITIKSNIYLFIFVSATHYLQKNSRAKSFLGLFLVTYSLFFFEKPPVEISKYSKDFKGIFQALENISAYFSTTFFVVFLQIVYMVYVSLFECADSSCQNLFKFFCPFEWLLCDVLNLNWHTTTPKIRNMKSFRYIL